VPLPWTTSAHSVSVTMTMTATLIRTVEELLAEDSYVYEPSPCDMAKSMRAAGRSVRAISEELGVSASQVSRWTQGSSPIPRARSRPQDRSTWGRYTLDISPELAEITRQAMIAFSEDLDYATSMCSNARQIIWKRALWSARTDLRAATAAAISQCAEAKPFTCASEQQCGVGHYCRYSSGEFVNLTTPAKPGQTLRPQASATPSFSSDSSLPELLEIRGVRM
jgi:hypothetical protein